ncbi:hypothetical protein EVAR_19657_1 [Eumeta japonica]|uniref:Uncharacterized protein n=1 Tax=Eumeta variegata TaxID=151549 RepID=A0A4C1V384_EUMVA|nr:hypothetical protein EVAR_19657_1 [Eumeta japonica]
MFLSYARSSRLSRLELHETSANKALLCTKTRYFESTLSFQHHEPVERRGRGRRRRARRGASADGQITRYVPKIDLPPNAYRTVDLDARRCGGRGTRPLLYARRFVQRAYLQNDENDLLALIAHSIDAQHFLNN